MAGEENAFEVFLHVAASEPTEPADPVEYREPFVSALQLLETVEEVFHEYLRDLLAACADDEPLE